MPQRKEEKKRREVGREREIKRRGKEGGCMKGRVTIYHKIIKFLH